jgi:hypothetical protein
MTDDEGRPARQHELLAARAYVKTIRGFTATNASPGFVGCLIGAMLLIWGRMGQGAPPGRSRRFPGDWRRLVLFAYVIIRRTRYVRAHPFDPQS